MRSDYPRERSSILVWLISILISCFVLQNVLLRLLGDYPSLYQTFARFFYLSAEGLSSFKAWTLLSYGLFHDPQNLLHILFSILGLYFLGREVEVVVGIRKFLILLLGSTLVGGLLWLLCHGSNGVLLGASAAISGLLLFFILLYPDRPITFLFLFFPITLPKAKYLGYGVLLFEVFGLVFFELQGEGSAIAHSAHLGGMLYGFIYQRYLYQEFVIKWKWPWKKSILQARPLEKAGAQASDFSFKLNLSEREKLRAEVDRILDKINSQGFGSLTSEEKKKLDEARDLLSRK